LLFVAHCFLYAWLFVAESGETRAAGNASDQIAVLMTQGNYAQAMYALARIDPKYRTGVETLQLAACFHMLRRYDEALQTLDALNPELQQELDANLLRADIYYALSLWEETAKVLTEAAQAFPDNPDIVLRMAQVREAMGDKIGAEAAYQTYARIQAATTGRD